LFQITFTDFQLAVKEDPLLLEACGSCLPSPKAISTFFFYLSTYEPQTGDNCSTDGNFLNSLSREQDKLRSDSCHTILSYW